MTLSPIAAVADASLVIPAADLVVVAIAGESGSGKTTLARLLLGILPPTGGSVRYRGAELCALSTQGRRAFRRQVQTVFQDLFEVFLRGRSRPVGRAGRRLVLRREVNDVEYG